MFRCHVCGSTESRSDTIDEVLEIDGKPVRVEGIPATVCRRCGEPTISRETTEKIRRMVHGEGRPIGQVCMDVFAFA